MAEACDAIVIGAGPAGLAAAACLGAGPQARHPGEVERGRAGLAAPLRPAASAHRSRTFRPARPADALVLRPLSVARAGGRLSRKLRRPIRSRADLRRPGPGGSPRWTGLARRSGRKDADRPRRRRRDRFGRLPPFADLARHGDVRRPDPAFEPLSQSGALRRKTRARRRIRQFGRRDRARSRGGRRRRHALGARPGQHSAARPARPADPDLGDRPEPPARPRRRRAQCADHPPRRRLDREAGADPRRQGPAPDGRGGRPHPASRRRHGRDDPRRPDQGARRHRALRAEDGRLRAIAAGAFRRGHSGDRLPARPARAAARREGRAERRRHTARQRRPDRRARPLLLRRDRVADRPVARRSGSKRRGSPTPWRQADRPAPESAADWPPHCRIIVKRSEFAASGVDIRP